ncbi:MAG: FHA domain-containing protein [Burkholderiales bacterium]|nr:FHA domain-containing protein [Burkholderiales bacterium]
MAKLILSLEGSMIREVPLDKERTMIGRKPSNEIQIENLAVSGEHACIVTILNDSFLEDLGSTNGTLVNGNPIKKHILQNNDVIEIGKYKLKYVADAPAAGQGMNEDFEKTMILRAPPKPSAAAKPVNEPAPPPKPSTPPPTPRPMAPAAVKPVAPAPVVAAPAPAAAAPAAAPAKPAETQPLATVQILTGPSAGKELDLVKNLTTLGKPGLQVAVITRRPQGYFITHVEGAKFPIINGKMIDAQAQPLQDHDVVELAGVKMEFFIKK